MLKVALLILIAYICEGAQHENAKLDREDACMRLVEHMPKMDRKKFEDTIGLRPDLRKRELQEKLLEQAFNYCITQISDSQARDILRVGPKKYRDFFDLIPLDVENINNPEDLALDPEWHINKREIRRRLSRNRRNQGLNKFEDL